MRTPTNPVVRKAAKGAVMAGTAALTVLAVGTLVKRRINTSANAVPETGHPAATASDAAAPASPSTEAASPHREEAE